MHYTLPAIPATYPIGAIYKNTAPNSTSPWVMPGNYLIKLFVDGKVLSQAVTIKMDPRVKTTMKDLQQQHDVSLLMYEERNQCITAMNELRYFRNQLKEKLKAATGNATLKDCDAEAAAFEQSPKGSTEKGFNQLYSALSSVFGNLQEGDMAPTSQTLKAANETSVAFKKLWKSWEGYKARMKICLFQ
jgi:6-pyruvoyl-tetrahydropterin synthase